MGRVVVVGSLTLNLVTHVERHPRPGETVPGAGLERLAGGKGANQAVAASAAGAAVVTAAARRACARGARVVLNLAPYLVVPPDVITLADPLVVNERAALLLADSESMPASPLVTFGAAGAAWDGDQLRGPEVDQAEVASPTGAGDAFCDALGAALVAGADRREALRTALAAGADALRHRGA